MSSRIARQPIEIPAGVELSLTNRNVKIKGPKGVLTHELPSAVVLDIQEQFALVSEVQGEDNAKALSGTTAALVRNHVHGVSKGFEKKLTLVGVGYRAAAKSISGKSALELTLGFSHPVVYEAPEGIQLTTATPTEIIVTGIDKQVVGQVASEIRAYRPPEPYKGKGVRYADETIILKETKK